EQSACSRRDAILHDQRRRLSDANETESATSGRALLQSRSDRSIAVRGAHVIAVLLGLCNGLAPTAARSAETVVTGVLGSYTSGVWPFLIGMKKGFFARHDIRPDVVFVPTAPGLVQQLAAGSLDIAAVNGLAEPLHAVEKGAPVAIMRII